MILFKKSKKIKEILINKNTKIYEIIKFNFYDGIRVMCN